MHKSITMEPVMKGVWEILLNPPGWSIIPAMIIGLVLIWIDARRAARHDTAHRSKINGEILHKLADFIDRYRPVTGQQPVLGQQLTGELARALVIAIARNEIPHVTISY
jgi:hypothetical protein